jgi:glycosyltransferase involved in cell wall biosynthesis
VVANERRPKLLFIAWNFPPAQAIGSVRTGHIAKYLARLGWEVMVLTPDHRLMRRVENPEATIRALEAEGIRHLWTTHDLRFLAPNHLICRNQGLAWFVGGIARRLSSRCGISNGIGWTRAAQSACCRLTRNDVDLILASGPPFSAFVLAERLSKTIGRPYVLDYRDPWWTETTGMMKSLRFLVSRLEGRLVGGAAAVSIVSRSWARDLDLQFKLGSKVQVITNGYDPEELGHVQPHDFGHFSIVYAGIFYPPERVITPVLEVLKRLKGQASDCYFHYYGDDDEHLRAEAVRLGVFDRVKLHGRVPRSEALSAIKGANVAVVIASVFDKASEGINGWIPAKLFENIGLGTPTLLISPRGSDVEALAEPTGLVRRFTGTDIEGMVSFIEQLRSGKTLKRANVDSTTWEFIANKLDLVLREVLVRFNLLDPRPTPVAN